MTLPAKSVSLAEWFNASKENGNDEDDEGAVHAREFKQEAVRLVEGGQSIAAAAGTLGVVEQTLHNWVKAHRQGTLKGADSKSVSAEQMEISRLRADLARVKMERDILGKAAIRKSVWAPEDRMDVTSAPEIVKSCCVLGFDDVRFFHRES